MYGSRQFTTRNREIEDSNECNDESDVEVLYQDTEYTAENMDKVGGHEAGLDMEKNR